MAEQSETEDHSLSYRTVCNKNHCKVLNVFYHEVLENHRVTTSLAGRREALFVPHEVREFDQELAWCTKPLLAPLLLDPSLLACYDALRRTLFRPEEKAGSGDSRATQLRLEIRIGNNGLSKNRPIKLLLFLDDGSQRAVDVERSGRWKKNSSYTHTVTTGPFDPAAVDKVGLLNDSSFAVTVAEHVISFLDPVGGGWVELGRASPGKVRAGSDTLAHSSYQPPPEPEVAPPDDGPSPEDDEECAEALLEHLNCHAFFYSSLLWLLEDRNERIARFEEIHCGEKTLADLVDPTPIGIMGKHVAFPAAGSEFIPEEEPPIVDDRLITLPTSGVFADAALGECTACEDVPAENDPFWKWVSNPNVCKGADISTKPPSESSILSSENVKFAGLPSAVFAVAPTPGEGEGTAKSLLDGFATELSKALLSSDPAVEISDLSATLEKLLSALEKMSKGGKEKKSGEKGDGDSGKKGDEDDG